MAEQKIIKEAETVVIELRRTYWCTGEHVARVAWRKKTLGEHCPHKTLQKECKKFCCECCPKRDKDGEAE